MAEIKNLQEASEMIHEAIKNQENIIVYGDADLDGISSTIIMKEAIGNLGGKVVDVYFPDREVEGYGISKIGLEFLKKYTPALLIAVDCGITNFEEVEIARSLGFATLIVDHHEVMDKLPKADLIVDPKQKGDKYPFKLFAAVGLAFRLAEALLHERMTENLRKNFMELVALATLADMMPREEDNALFVEEGMSELESTWRPGLRVFLDVPEIRSYPSVYQKASRMISVLNIRDTDNRLPAGYRLLSCADMEEAKELLKDLLEKNKIKKNKTMEIQKEVEKRVAAGGESPIVFEADEKFDLNLLGSVASELTNKYYKPVFLVKKMQEESVGTIRSSQGVNSVELMKKCEKYLLTFGGHPQASGFRLKNENLEKLKACIIKNLK